MTRSKKDSINDEITPSKTKEETVSLAKAVDALGILDSKKFYIMKKYKKEEEKTISNWSLFFTKLKLV